MTERWRTELRRIDALSPDDDLVDRAIRRPVHPAPDPRPATRVAIIAFALLIPIALIYGAFVVLGSRDAARPLDGGVGSTPANGELLYTKRLSTGWGLFALDPTTDAERQITNGTRDYGSDWSPDGTKIVYDREGDGNGIWVVGADGSNPTQLIHNGRVPSWSPDGTKIAFAHSDPGTMVPLGPAESATGSSIYVMNADGTDVQRLTPSGSSDYLSDWSPDGTQIAYSHDSVLGSAVFVIGADGSDPHQIVARNEILAFDWSPDGTTLAVAVNGTKGGAPGGILLVPADGSGEPTMLPGSETAYPDYVNDPAWSPDGRWIAYSAGGSGTIVIVHPDGSERRTLNVDPATDTIEELTWGAAPPASSPSP
jgi:Tol biopolymer transport system component